MSRIIVVDTADDLVEAIVDEAIAVRLGVPCRKAVLYTLAVALDGEVNDRRRAILFSVLNDFDPEERVVLADLMERFTLSVDAAIKAKKHRRHL